MTSYWVGWTRERGLVSNAEQPTRELTVTLFDCFARELVPTALRTLSLDAWAGRFHGLSPLAMGREDLARELEALRAMSPVMAEVMAARKQHLFFSSFLRAVEELSVSENEYDHLFVDSGAWSMACRRLLSVLSPGDVMRDAFQLVIDREASQE